MSQLDRMIDHLTRFPTACQDSLIKTVVISPRIAQLAFAHPLMFLLLATDYGSASDRRAAIARTEAGQPLVEVCAALGIPKCLSRLPPEACIAELPVVRWSAGASRELSSLIPRTPAAMENWLEAIFLAHSVCDETFALWLARQRSLFAGRSVPHMPLRGLALYAWCSTRSPIPLDNAQSQAWNTDFSLDSACIRAGTWAREVAVLADLGPTGLADPWIPAASVDGFAFVPILTPDDLLGEARVMNNCVACYSDRLAHGSSRLYSIRSRSRHVATVEVEFQPAKRHYVVREIRGPRNVTCPIDVVQAAYEWLAVYAPPRPPKDSGYDPAKRSSLLTALLSPYLDDHPATPAATLVTALDMLLHTDLVRTELWLATRAQAA